MQLSKMLNAILISNKIQAYFLSEIGIESQTLNPHRVDYMLTKPVVLSGSANWYQ